MGQVYTLATSSFTIFQWQSWRGMDVFGNLEAVNIGGLPILPNYAEKKDYFNVWGEELLCNIQVQVVWKNEVALQFDHRVCSWIPSNVDKKWTSSLVLGTNFNKRNYTTFIFSNQAICISSLLTLLYTLSTVMFIYSIVHHQKSWYLSFPVCWLPLVFRHSALMETYMCTYIFDYDIPGDS